jgi:hypothetical protein
LPTIHPGTVATVTFYGPGEVDAEAQRLALGVDLDDLRAHSGEYAIRGLTQGEALLFGDGGGVAGGVIVGRVDPLLIIRISWVVVMVFWAWAIWTTLGKPPDWQPSYGARPTPKWLTRDRYRAAGIAGIVAGVSLFAVSGLVDLS